MREKELEKLKDYKYGFSTDIENFKAPKGLNEEVIKFISKIKPTYCNNDIGMKHIGKINDDEFKISNKNYIFYLFRTENFYKILNLLFKNQNYFHLFLISLYLRFKYKKN